MAPSPTPVPIESLLEHRAWVHRVARALVSDASAADDLEQETWIRAQANPPRHAGALKAWLGTVLRRAAADMRRSERRRERREEAAARPERQRSTVELVAETEAQKRVVTALLELEEPYRTALLLRYSDDLTPPQIAERTGVPLETARTRLKRGLEKLRQRFDRESGGHRAAWALLLQPLADRACPGPLVPVGGVSVVGTALGALLMTLKTKTGLAVATLALAALGIAMTTRPAYEASSRETASTTSAPELASAPDLRAALSRSGSAVAARGRAAEVAGDASPAPSIAGGCGILVEVLDEGGARVRSGSVHLALGEAHTVDLLLKRVDLMQKMASDMERYAWLSEPLDLAKANPAEVRDISAEFAGLAIEARADVPPYAPVVSQLPSVIEAGKIISVRLTVIPGRRVEFLVSDAADGRPVANARVVSMTEISRRGVSPEDVNESEGAGWATTDVGGRATVAELGAGLHDVEILAEGYRAGRLDDSPLDAPLGGGPITIRLEVNLDDAGLDVVVRDPSGAPVADQKILLNTRLRRTPLSAITDAFGVVRFRAIPPGLQVVRLDVKTWLIRSRTAAWPEDPRCTLMAYVEELPAGETRQVALGYLPAGGAITYEVVDAEGRPVPGMDVHLVGTRFRDGKTDVAGRAVFADVGPGTYRAFVGPKGGQRWLDDAHDLAEGGSLEVRHVTGTSSVTGFVRAVGEGHPPIAGANATLSGHGSISVSSEPDGSFVVRDVAPGHYRLEASADGFVSTSVEIDVSGVADAVAQDLVLSRGGRILLRAAAADHAAMADARLRLLDPQGNEVALAQDVTGGDAFRRTDRLAPGRYALEVVRVGRPTSARTIDVEEGKDAVVVLAAP